MTQVKTRPPTFVLFASIADAVPEDYKRFLVNGLRRDFDMPGTPIRLLPAGRGQPLCRAAEAERDVARQAQAAAARGIAGSARGQWFTSFLATHNSCTSHAHRMH